MVQKIAQKIFFDWMGWKVNVTIPRPKKCITALAPHTSNWDFIIGQLYSYATNDRCHFMMKKEWFFWPIGILMRHLGGIPVYRNKQMKSTEVMAKKAMEMEEFHLCITPEGTRKPTEKWKSGFYYIALGAGIPILLYGIDFERKLVECTKMIIPSGDIEKDMKEIKEHFKQYKGKKPQNFVI